MEIFEALLTKAKQETDAEQIIALRTADGQIYVMQNQNILTGDYSDEDRFLQFLALQENTEVTHLVSIWQGGLPDVPSMHFRQGLLKMNRNNEHTLLLLRGEAKYLAKQLITTLPNQEKTERKETL